jgi:hypothetical protein
MMHGQVITEPKIFLLKLWGRAHLTASQRLSILMIPYLELRKAVIYKMLRNHLPPIVSGSQKPVVSITAMRPTEINAAVNVRRMEPKAEVVISRAVPSTILYASPVNIPDGDDLLML